MSLPLFFFYIKHLVNLSNALPSWQAIIVFRVKGNFMQRTQILAAYDVSDESQKYGRLFEKNHF